MSAGEVFIDLLDVVLPDGGYAVALARAFMDESYDGTDHSEYVHACGYVFGKAKAEQFTAKWGAYLKSKGLPHFHMKDCAHGNETMKGWPKPDRDAVARKLIEMTHKYTTFGFAVSVRQESYYRHVAPREGMPQSAYAFALFSALLRVRKWTERTGFNGSISYFFENGHDEEGKADQFMKWMFKSERIKRNNSYGSHSFVDKATPGLHPADMLSWHWNAEVIRRNDPNRRAPRKDFQALVRDQDKVIEYDDAGLIAVALGLEELERKRHALTEAFLAGEVDLPALEGE